jgi:hypothetical protein
MDANPCIHRSAFFGCVPVRTPWLAFRVRGQAETTQRARAAQLPLAGVLAPALGAASPRVPWLASPPPPQPCRQPSCVSRRRSQGRASVPCAVPTCRPQRDRRRPFLETPRTALRWQASLFWATHLGLRPSAFLLPPTGAPRHLCIRGRGPQAPFPRPGSRIELPSAACKCVSPVSWRRRGAALVVARSPRPAAETHPPQRRQDVCVRAWFRLFCLRVVPAPAVFPAAGRGARSSAAAQTLWC